MKRLGRRTAPPAGFTGWPSGCPARRDSNELRLASGERIVVAWNDSCRAGRPFRGRGRPEVRGGTSSYPCGSARRAVPGRRAPRAAGVARRVRQRRRARTPAAPTSTSGDGRRCVLPRRCARPAPGPRRRSHDLANWWSTGCWRCARAPARNSRSNAETRCSSCQVSQRLPFAVEIPCGRCGDWRATFAVTLQQHRADCRNGEDQARSGCVGPQQQLLSLIQPSLCTPAEDDSTSAGLLGQRRAPG